MLPKGKTTLKKIVCLFVTSKPIQVTAFHKQTYWEGGGRPARRQMTNFLSWLLHMDHRLLSPVTENVSFQQF